MYSTQPSDKRTGQYSRIVNPRLPITQAPVYQKIHAGKNPGIPVRNPLAGAGVTPTPSFLHKLAAWLRGE